MEYKTTNESSVCIDLPNRFADVIFAPFSHDDHFMVMDWVIVNNDDSMYIITSRLQATSQLH